MSFSYTPTPSTSRLTGREDENPFLSRRPRSTTFSTPQNINSTNPRSHTFLPTPISQPIPATTTPINRTRRAKPPINPYEEFSAKDFDSYVDGITGRIKRALFYGEGDDRKDDVKGKGREDGLSRSDFEVFSGDGKESGGILDPSQDEAGGVGLLGPRDLDGIAANGSRQGEVEMEGEVMGLRNAQKEPEPEQVEETEGGEVEEGEEQQEFVDFAEQDEDEVDPFELGEEDEDEGSLAEDDGVGELEESFVEDEEPEGELETPPPAAQPKSNRPQPQAQAVPDVIEIGSSSEEEDKGVDDDEDELELDLDEEELEQEEEEEEEEEEDADEEDGQEFRPKEMAQVGSRLFKPSFHARSRDELDVDDDADGEEIEEEEEDEDEGSEKVTMEEEERKALLEEVMKLKKSAEEASKRRDGDSEGGEAGVDAGGESEEDDVYEDEEDEGLRRGLSEELDGEGEFDVDGRETELEEEFSRVNGTVDTPIEVDDSSPVGSPPPPRQRRTSTPLVNDEAPEYAEDETPSFVPMYPSLPPVSSYSSTSSSDIHTMDQDENAALQQILSQISLPSIPASISSPSLSPSLPSNFEPQTTTSTVMSGLVVDPALLEASEFMATSTSENRDVVPAEEESDESKQIVDDVLKGMDDFLDGMTVPNDVVEPPAPEPENMAAIDLNGNMDESTAAMVPAPDADTAGDELGGTVDPTANGGEEMGAETVLNESPVNEKTSVSSEVEVVNVGSEDEDEDGIPEYSYSPSILRTSVLGAKQSLEEDREREEEVDDGDGDEVEDGEDGEDGEELDVSDDGIVIHGSPSTKPIHIPLDDDLSATQPLSTKDQTTTWGAAEVEGGEDIYNVEHSPSPVQDEATPALDINSDVDEETAQLYGIVRKYSKVDVEGGREPEQEEEMVLVDDADNDGPGDTHPTNSEPVDVTSGQEQSITDELIRSMGPGFVDTTSLPALTTLDTADGFADPGTSRERNGTVELVSTVSGGQGGAEAQDPETEGQMEFLLYGDSSQMQPPRFALPNPIAPFVGSQSVDPSLLAPTEIRLQDSDATFDGPPDDKRILPSHAPVVSVDVESDIPATPTDAPVLSAHAEQSGLDLEDNEPGPADVSIADAPIPGYVEPNGQDTPSESVSKIASTDLSEDETSNDFPARVGNDLATDAAEKMISNPNGPRSPGFLIPGLQPAPGSDLPDPSLPPPPTSLGHPPVAGLASRIRDLAREGLRTEASSVIVNLPSPMTERREMFTSATDTPVATPAAAEVYDGMNVEASNADVELTPSIAPEGISEAVGYASGGSDWVDRVAPEGISEAVGYASGGSDWVDRVAPEGISEAVGYASDGSDWVDRVDFARSQTLPLPGTDDPPVAHLDESPESASVAKNLQSGTIDDLGDSRNGPNGSGDAPSATASPAPRLTRSQARTQGYQPASIPASPPSSTSQLLSVPSTGRQRSRSRTREISLSDVSHATRRTPSPSETSRVTQESPDSPSSRETEAFAERTGLDGEEVIEMASTTPAENGKKGRKRGRKSQADRAYRLSKEDEEIDDDDDELEVTGNKKRKKRRKTETGTKLTSEKAEEQSSHPAEVEAEKDKPNDVVAILPEPQPAQPTTRRSSRRNKGPKDSTYKPSADNQSDDEEDDSTNAPTSSRKRKRGRARLSASSKKILTDHQEVGSPAPVARSRLRKSFTGKGRERGEDTSEAEDDEDGSTAAERKEPHDEIEIEIGNASASSTHLPELFSIVPLMRPLPERRDSGPRVHHHGHLRAGASRPPIALVPSVQSQTRSLPQPPQPAQPPSTLPLPLQTLPKDSEPSAPSTSTSTPSRAIRITSDTPSSTPSKQFVREPPHLPVTRSHCYYVKLSIPCPPIASSSPSVLKTVSPSPGRGNEEKGRSTTNSRNGRAKREQPKPYIFLVPSCSMADKHDFMRAEGVENLGPADESEEGLAVKIGGDDIESNASPAKRDGGGTPGEEKSRTPAIRQDALTTLIRIVGTDLFHEGHCEVLPREPDGDGEEDVTDEEAGEEEEEDPEEVGAGKKEEEDENEEVDMELATSDEEQASDRDDDKATGSADAKGETGKEAREVAVGVLIDASEKDSEEREHVDEDSGVAVGELNETRSTNPKRKRTDDDGPEGKTAEDEGGEESSRLPDDDGDGSESSKMSTDGAGVNGKKQKKSWWSLW